MSKFQYRESEYFNDKEDFLIYTNLGKVYVGKCHWYNGAWYFNSSLRYKMTSVLAVSFSEFYGAEIQYKGTELKGKVVKCMEPDQIGVIWESGQNIRKYGLPNFWNNNYNLEL